MFVGLFYKLTIVKLRGPNKLLKTNLKQAMGYMATLQKSNQIKIPKQKEIQNRKSDVTLG